MQFYIYRTGYTGATPPFDIVRVNIFNGIPSNPASISVFGDDTSNRFVSGTDSQMYRIFNSSVPAPGTVPGTTRKIWNIKANVITTLNPGTYWIKYQFADAAMNPGFAPSVTIP